MNHLDLLATEAVEKYWPGPVATELKTELYKLIRDALTTAYNTGKVEGVTEAAKCIPTNWCDSLLTGPDGIKVPATCADIEKLLHGVAEAILKLIEKGEKA